MTTVYSFNAAGRLIGPVVLTDSDISPLEPGVYLIPGNCTNAPPPENKDGVFAAWDGAAWGYVSDLSPAEPPTPEPTPEQLREGAKATRASAVGAITVTTAAGNTFDGDETAQRRMASAITAMTDADLLPWVLHDNSIMMVNKSELIEALRLAGMQMASIWITPYTG